MNNRLKIKYAVIILVPITIILNLILRGHSEFVEKYYSNLINKYTRQALSLITSPFNFSVAELLVVLAVIISIVFLVLLIIKIRKGGVLNHLLNIAFFASALYVLFMLLWGFNYNRLSFDKIAGYNIEKSSEKELYSLCELLIRKADILREGVIENSKGVMTIPGGYKDILNRTNKGYEKASAVYPVFKGKYGPPKPILLSKKMSYTGITGVYFPFTGEANVNINSTDFMLPCTAAHEAAHQRGFAREDEANYIAYLTCTMHPDLDFQYSGVMLAVIYSTNALASKDIEAYRLVAENYSMGVRRDLKNNAEFWSKYEGPVEKVSDKVNDRYLKSNGQKDGVQSYGRMVDLLLAEYKKKNIIP